MVYTNSCLVECLNRYSCGSYWETHALGYVNCIFNYDCQGPIAQIRSVARLGLAIYIQGIPACKIHSMGSEGHAVPGKF